MNNFRYATPIQTLNITSPNKQTNSSSNTSSKQFHVPHENNQKKHKTNENNESNVLLNESEEKMCDQERLANCYMDASLQVNIFIINLIFG